ncbi:MAG: hypothetical protein IJU50_05625, partial [Lachnospiraceae bacterium]|nr:hypothetical protein [Lachnospiraceae bacterium]
MKKKMFALPVAVCLLASMLAGCGGKIDVDSYQQPASQDSGTASGGGASTGGDASSADAQSGEAGEASGELTYAEGTTLRMATGYNSTKTGLSLDAEVAGEGITLADGVTYHAGDLKPTWVEVQNVLGIQFEDKYQGNSASDEFDYWKERMSDVDMVSGTAAKLTEYGEQGVVVNIGNYLNQMPNFKAYLDANP